MAGANLLTLIDDIAALLDDVAVMTKVAAKKAAGVLGDDLALNAEQVTGVASERELPVVWAVAKGSTVNKLILVPVALAISAIAPWMVTPLLMLGGGFLCFEGFEKVMHKVLHPNAPSKSAAAAANARSPEEMAAWEAGRIRGAIRTDFILSAEIIIITLGTVADQALLTRVLVLSTISAGMTVGVYGLVAGIVKLDDGGLALTRREAEWQQSLGHAVLRGAPLLMKGLGIFGTAAMFLVGGGIVVHGVPALHHLVEDLAQGAGAGLIKTAANGLVGILVGGVLVALFEGGKKVAGK